MPRALLLVKEDFFFRENDLWQNNRMCSIPCCKIFQQDVNRYLIERTHRWMDRWAEKEDSSTALQAGFK